MGHFYACLLVLGRFTVTSPPGPFFVFWYLFRREKSWYTENDNSEFQDVLEGCTALLEELR